MQVIIGKAGGLSNDEAHRLLGVFSMLLAPQFAKSEVVIAIDNNIYMLGRGIVISERIPEAIDEWCFDKNLVIRMIEAQEIADMECLFFRGGNTLEKFDFLSPALDHLGGDAWANAYTVLMCIQLRSRKRPLVTLSQAWIDSVVQANMMQPVAGRLDSSKAPPHPAVLWRQLHRICSLCENCEVAIVPRFVDLEVP